MGALERRGVITDPRALPLLRPDTKGRATSSQPNQRVFPKSRLISEEAFQENKRKREEAERQKNLKALEEWYARGAAQRREEAEKRRKTEEERRRKEEQKKRRRKHSGGLRSPLQYDNRLRRPLGEGGMPQYLPPHPRGPYSVGGPGPDLGPINNYQSN